MAFSGWPAEALEFYEGLTADNSKTYWTAHKDRYERDVHAPMAALLAELEGEFGAGKIFRPYRDIRFSADKSPYKLNIYADVERGGYVALDAEGLVAAGGRYMVDDAELKKLRAAVAKDRSGKELVAIVEDLRTKGNDVSGQELKRVPPPYPQDHPRGDLLRHKRLIYWKRWPVGPWIATVRAKERVATAWRDGAALEAWCSRYMD